MLTHLKEKLQYVQAENADGRQQLKQVEALAAQVGGLNWTVLEIPVTKLVGRGKERLLT